MLSFDQLELVSLHEKIQQSIIEMGIGHHPKLILHERDKTQNFIIKLELGIALDENQEGTFIEGASGALHIEKEMGHGVERANLGELAKNLLVDGGSG